MQKLANGQFYLKNAFDNTYLSYSALLSKLKTVTMTKPGANEIWKIIQNNYIASVQYNVCIIAYPGRTVKAEPCRNADASQEFTISNV